MTCTSSRRTRWFVASILAVACGARSGLNVGDAPDLPDTAVVSDSGLDAGRDARPDADASLDADVDASVDAPVDTKPDVIFDGPLQCPTPDATFIYAITNEAQLLAFRPQDSTFEQRGKLSCPGTTETPFSMAINSNTNAFAVFGDGHLFAVDVFNVTCQPTPYVAPPPNFAFHLFGMGFALDDVTNQETLFIADINFDTPSAGLARIDTQSFARTIIGPFSQNPGNALELTSGADGRLWGYFLDPPLTDGTLVRIDSSNAQILESHALSAGGAGNSLAVAFWVGAFYVFSGGGGITTVTRIEPATQTATVVATTSGHVVGAAVAPCASIGSE